MDLNKIFMGPTKDYSEMRNQLRELFVKETPSLTDYLKIREPKLIGLTLKANEQADVLLSLIKSIFPSMVVVKPGKAIFFTTRERNHDKVGVILTPGGKDLFLTTVCVRSETQGVVTIYRDIMAPSGRCLHY